jgi:hypothetical protein
MARRRPEAWRTGYAIRGSGGGLTAATVFGNEWFYDGNATVTGNGKNPDQPTTDFETLLGVVGSNDAIYVAGDIRAQVTAPQDVYGVKIIGAVGGRPRHVTDSGVVMSGNGCAWREEATAAGTPLLTLREQGWEIHNILMIPETGTAAVKLHRTELAAAMDASHAVFNGVKFISSGTRVGYGLEDVGGAYRVLVENCEFVNLEFAWKQTSLGIANPSAHVWRNNVFDSNKTDIAMNALACLFENNRFQTPYDGTTHPTTLNLASAADAGSATRKNLVLNNVFADAAADVTIAKGYKPATGDVWRNKVTNTAADIVTVPS